MKINRTTERTIKILDLISKNPNGLSLTEISKILDIPKTSTYDIINTLLHMKAINLIDLDLKKFGIGIKSFEIGSAYIQNAELIKIVEKPLKELAVKLHRTVFIGVESDGEVTYLNKYESESAIRTTANLGSKNPIYCTGLGKAILSGYDSEKINEILEKIELIPKTKYTLITKEDLLSEVKNIRKRGYSFDDRELEESMFCIAAPIFNHENQVIAAISSAGIYDERINSEEYGKIVSEAALSISKKLGYMKEKLYQ